MLVSGTAGTRSSPTPASGARSSLAWPRADLAKNLYPPEGASLVSGPFPPGVPENAPDVAPPSSIRRRARGCSMRPAGRRARTDRAARGGPQGRRSRCSPGRTGRLRNLVRDPAAGLRRRSESRSCRGRSTGRPTRERADRGEFEVQLAGRLFLPPILDPYPYFHSSQWSRRRDRTTASTRTARRTGHGERAARGRSGARIELIAQRAPPARRRSAGDFLWGADQSWAISKRLDDVEISPTGPLPLPAGSARLASRRGKRPRPRRPATNSSRP